MGGRNYIWYFIRGSWYDRRGYGTWNQWKDHHNSGGKHYFLRDCICDSVPVFQSGLFKDRKTAQFEDDEYYYYVKAVPKAIVAGDRIKKLTRFSGKEEQDRMTKKRFAEEMEIERRRSA